MRALGVKDVWRGPLDVDEIGWSGRLGLGKNLGPLHNDFNTAQQPEFWSTSPNHNF